MNHIGLRERLEQELTWRRNEIRLLHNQLANIGRVQDQDIYRRSLVVMLYAHFEGFCKTAFGEYISAVNDAQVKCSEAVPAIVATTWEAEFKRLESDEKSEDFRLLRPDDSRLHRFYRRRMFIQSLENFWEKIVHLSSDVVDTESNLKPGVLRKLLYIVGLDPRLFAEHESTIQQLVHRRNGISHGSERAGVRAESYKKLEFAAFTVMDEIMRSLESAIKDEQYRIADAT